HRVREVRSRHLPGARGWRQSTTGTDAKRRPAASMVVHTGRQAARVLGKKSNLDRGARRPGRSAEGGNAGAVSQEPFQRRGAVDLPRRQLAGVSIERIRKE